MHVTSDDPVRVREILRKRWVKPTAIVLVSLLVGWFILRFIGKISWSAVGDAVRSVSFWELLALIGMLLVRQTVNALPIARFTPGLGLPKAVVSDVSANLAGTVAPPPGDVVVRIAQFRTWGINPVDGMAGATLNMLVFYGARFAAPAIGAVIFSIYAFDTGKAVAGAVSLLIAIAIVVALVAVLRSESIAARLARRAARAANTMSATVEEERWVEAVLDFRRRIDGTLRGNLAPALFAMILGIVIDAAMLVAAVRFVGIGADVAPWPVILGSVLLAYPLTILPMFGLGVLDAVVIANIVDVAGAEYESALVGATVVWRVITLGGTLGLGALAMAWWRATTRKSAPSEVVED